VRELPEAGATGRDRAYMVLRERRKKGDRSVRQTNNDLKRYYRVANWFYFKNKLPNTLPIRFAKSRRLGRTVVLNCKHPVLIEVSDRLRFSSNLTIMTVLHEMVHVENPKPIGHGAWFNRRMEKLARAGAFDGLW
jgi:hypothetical protein